MLMAGADCEPISESCRFRPFGTTPRRPQLTPLRWGRFLAEGIAKAKAAGVYKGRPPSIDVIKVRELKKKDLGASEIAKALKIGRASVYRALET